MSDHALSGNILCTVRWRSDYIMGFVELATGPTKSKKLTGLLSVATQYPQQSLNENSKHGFALNKCFLFKLCRGYCVATLSSSVSFLDLFGPIAGAINPIT